MNNFYCASIENNIRIEGSNVTGLRILPCCVYQTDKNYHSLAEYNASEEIKNLKTSKTWTKGCSVCQRQEQQGQTSYRQHSNESLKDINGLRYEIFPSNICNLKCLMCSPSNSSAYAQEQRIIGIADERYVKEFDISDQVIDIMKTADNIESISLIGGEFFLSKGNIDILDYAITNDIALRVVTNATVILPEHLSKLQQIKNLELQISVDGIQEHYEFMRYPATWNKFEENVKKLIAELPRARINFHYVVQALNATNLVASLEYLNTFKKPTRITNLVHPAHLSWSILRETEKSRIVSNMTSQIEQHRITERQRRYVLDLIKTVEAVSFDGSSRSTFDRLIGRTLAHRQLKLVEAVGLEPTIDSV